MNIENIKALAKILCENGLTAIDVGEGENRIRIEKEASVLSPPLQPIITSQQSVPSAAISEDKAETDDQSINYNHLTEVKSPMVGVYYSSPSPDSEPFVSIGSKVKKGDVLCIIEAMKLMNEITAEQDGEIVDMYVKNGDIAEYGQVLFKML